MAFYDEDRDRNRRGFNQQWNDEDDRFERNRNYGNYGGMSDYEGRRERNYGEGSYGSSDFENNRGYGGGRFGNQGNRGGYRGMNEGNRGSMGYGSSDFGSSDFDYNQRQGRGNYGYQGGSFGYQGNRGGYSGMDEGNWGNRGYGRSNYGSGRGYDQDRDFWDKTKDEVSSWFGDDEARRRRRMDEMRGEHRGKGPKGYTRSDDRIREDINDRLSDAPQIDASDIDVTVNNGEVTLTGHVNSRWEKRHAEDIVEDISGVKHVENRLRVSSSMGTSTSEYSRSGVGTTNATTAGTTSTTNLGTTGSTNVGKR